MLELCSCLAAAGEGPTRPLARALPACEDTRSAGRNDSLPNERSQVTRAATNGGGFNARPQHAPTIIDRIRCVDKWQGVVA